MTTNITTSANEFLKPLGKVTSTLQPDPSPPVCGQPLPTSYDSESECQHAMTMTYTTRETALAEREAAARQLDEGKLFVEMLVHRLDRAQKKLDMAEEQLDITKRLIASDATSLLVVKRLHEQGMPHNGFLIGQ